MTALEKQKICAITSGPLTMNNIDHEDNTNAETDNMGERQIGCSVAKVVMIPTMSQVAVQVRGATTALKSVETHPHLMRRTLPMVARGLWDVTTNRPFTLPVLTWSKTVIKLPKNITTAQCIALPNILWLTPLHGDSVNMAQLYKETEEKE